MSSMFNLALRFDQCLSTWADKTSDNVVTIEMFDINSSCPNKNADPINGPWCQDESASCSASR